MESISFLPDPVKDRQVPSVKPPPNKPLPNCFLFPDSSHPSTKYISIEFQDWHSS